MSPTRVPDELEDLVADIMLKHGPDRHIDGHEKIAEAVWMWFHSQPTAVAVQSPTPPGLTKGEATAPAGGLIEDAMCFGDDVANALGSVAAAGLLDAEQIIRDKLLDLSKAPPELKGAREPKPGEIDAYFAEEHAKAAGLDAVAEYLREMAKRETPSNAKWGELGMVSRAHWKIRAQEVIEIASRPSTPVSLVSPAPEGMADVAMRNGQSLLLMEAENRNLKSALYGCIRAMMRIGVQYQPRSDVDFKALNVARKLADHPRDHKFVADSVEGYSMCGKCGWEQPNIESEELPEPQAQPILPEAGTT